MKRQKGFLDSDLSFYGMFFLIMSIVVALAIGAQWYFENMACTSRANGLSLESDWGPIQGCLVKVGNRYAPIEYIRITDDEKIIISGDGQ